MGSTEADRCGQVMAQIICPCRESNDDCSNVQPLAQSPYGQRYTGSPLLIFYTQVSSSSSFSSSYLGSAMCIQVSKSSPCLLIIPYHSLKSSYPQTLYKITQPIYPPTICTRNKAFQRNLKLGFWKEKVFAFEIMTCPLLCFKKCHLFA